jgi:hypothetical protein
MARLYSGVLSLFRPLVGAALCLLTADLVRSANAESYQPESNVILLRNDPGFDGPAREAYCLGPDGQWSPWQGSFRPELRLEPQQALVAVLKR